VVGNGREKVRQNGEATPAERFTADTAKSTGQSERAVQRDAARGALGDELAELKGTSLDKGVELDALAKMSAAAGSDASNATTPARSASVIPAALASERYPAVSTTECMPEDIRQRRTSSSPRFPLAGPQPGRARSRRHAPCESLDLVPSPAHAGPRC
jgi:hypothetical protein